MSKLIIFVLLIAAGLAMIALCGWLLKWRTTQSAPFILHKWSTWLAGINAVLWAHLTATSGSLLGFVYFVPQWAQIPLVIIVFLVGWIIPVVAANVKQHAIVEKVANADPAPNQPCP